MSEVVKFYDNFSERQVSAGINHRHLAVFHYLKQAGLKDTDDILEVGCGVGTVSKLILKYLTNRGRLLGVDISPVSIREAQKLTDMYSNSKFEVRDLVLEILPLKFDVIVLPDVIEHIPVMDHAKLFANLSAMLKDNGFVFIHIPHPNYLQWLIENDSNSLQIIDQPIHTDKFLSTVYPAGFYLHSLSSYSVYVVGEDYQVIVLKKYPTEPNYGLRTKYFRVPLRERIFEKIRYIIRGLK